MHYARTGYSIVCTIICTIVHWTVHLMRILRVQQLQISHQAYNGPDLKKLKTSSAHNIKTDHLVLQHFFFSVLAEGYAQMHAQLPTTSRQHLQACDVPNHIHRVQLSERATIPLHSCIPLRSSHSSARTSLIAFCRIGAQTPWVFINLQ
jgi:hypothetical protein